MDIKHFEHFKHKSTNFRLTIQLRMWPILGNRRSGCHITFNILHLHWSPTRAVNSRDGGRPRLASELISNMQTGPLPPSHPHNNDPLQVWSGFSLFLISVLPSLGNQLLMREGLVETHNVKEHCCCQKSKMALICLYSHVILVCALCRVRYSTVHLLMSGHKASADEW